MASFAGWIPFAYPVPAAYMPACPLAAQTRYHSLIWQDSDTVPLLSYSDFLLQLHHRYWLSALMFCAGNPFSDLQLFHVVWPPFSFVYPGSVLLYSAQKVCAVLSLIALLPLCFLHTPPILI